MCAAEHYRFRMILYFFILNLFDVVSTHLFITETDAIEGHPLYAYLYVEYGVYAFAAAKIILALIIAFFVLMKMRVLIAIISNVVFTIIVSHNLFVMYGDPVSWVIYQLSMFAQS